MPDIFFSVVICAYNASEYLPECLASLENQSKDNFEVIIVDDGSTDDTFQVSASYAASRANIFIYRTANQGPLLARRRGLLHAKGSHVLFLDADDMIRCDTIELCTRAIESHNPDIVIFQSSRSQNFKATNSKPRPECGFYTDRKQIRSLILAGNINSVWGKVFKSNLFDLDCDYSAYSDVRHGEDLLQLLPVFGACGSALVIGETLYFYRPNSRSSTSSYRQDQRRDVLVVLGKATEYACRWGLQAVDAHAWARNIVYLITILFNDKTIDCNRRKLELEAIAGSIREFFGGDATRLRILRSDYRLLIKLLLNGRYRLLKASILAREKFTA